MRGWAATLCVCLLPVSEAILKDASLPLGVLVGVVGIALIWLAGQNESAPAADTAKGAKTINHHHTTATGGDLSSGYDR